MPNIVETGIYVILLYLLMVFALFVYWMWIRKFTNAKEMVANKDTYVDVKVNLFRKDIWTAVKRYILGLGVFYFCIICIVYKVGFGVLAIFFLVGFPCTVAMQLIIKTVSDIKTNFGRDNSFRVISKV